MASNLDNPPPPPPQKKNSPQKLHRSIFLSDEYFSRLFEFSSCTYCFTHLLGSVVVHVLTLGLLSPLVHLIPVSLLDLLHLLGVAAEGSSELPPGLEGDGDGVPVAGLDLADPQEHAVLVGAHVEEEPLGVHHDGSALGELAVAPRGPPAKLLVLSAVVVDELGERVSELDQALRRQRDGLAGLHAAAGTSPSSAEAGTSVDGLADAQEPPALILLQVEVVFAVLTYQELALQRPPRASVITGGRLRDLLRAARPQLRVMLDEIPEVVAELGRHGHGKSQAALGAPGAHLGYLNEAALRVLLDIQVEALVLDIQALGRQLLGLLLPLEVLEPPALAPAVSIRHLQHLQPTSPSEKRSSLPCSSTNGSQRRSIGLTSANNRRGALAGSPIGLRACHSEREGGALWFHWLETFPPPVQAFPVLPELSSGFEGELINIIINKIIESERDALPSMLAHTRNVL